MVVVFNFQICYNLDRVTPIWLPLCCGRWYRRDTGLSHRGRYVQDRSAVSEIEVEDNVLIKKIP